MLKEDYPEKISFLLCSALSCSGNYGVASHFWNIRLSWHFYYFSSSSNPNTSTDFNISKLEAWLSIIRPCMQRSGVSRNWFFCYCRHWTPAETETTAIKNRNEGDWTKTGSGTFFPSLRQNWNLLLLYGLNAQQHQNRSQPRLLYAALRRLCLGNERYLNRPRITSKAELLPLHNQHHYMTAVWLKTNNTRRNTSKT